MAWTTPATYTDGAVLTGAQMNLIRDNLNETAPAKATTAGGIFVATGANAIAQRLITQTEVTTSESTTSTTYVALATAQALTVTTGTQALVMISSQIAQATPGDSSLMSYAVSGATTVAANDKWGLDWMSTTSNYFGAFSRVYYHTGLTSGSNTFTAQFRSGAGGTANFRNRQIMVVPL